MKFPSPAELVVMRALKGAQSPLYGLQIVEASEGEIAKDGIYVQLGRLAAKGFVKCERPTARMKRKHPGMARPLYALTETGAKLLSLVDESTV